MSWLPGNLLVNGMFNLMTDLALDPFMDCLEWTVSYSLVKMLCEISSRSIVQLELKNLKKYFSFGLVNM